MLRRVNAALFEAPPGARIQIVAEAQSNSGFSDARFEYGLRVLPRETIRGLPGCSFTVADSAERLEAFVTFTDEAPDVARYDLFEVENGALSALQKFVKKSESAPLMSFTIEPIAVAAAARRSARPPTGRRAAAAKRTRKKNAARKTGRKSSTTTKRASRKASIKSKETTARKAAKKASPKKRTASKKTRRSAVTRRRTSSTRKVRGSRRR